MWKCAGIGLLLLLSFASAARLPLDFAGISSTKNQHDELEKQLPGQSLDSNSQQSTERDRDDSSPIESRYEEPDSESSDETMDYDIALEEILEDIVDTLQTHPDLLKELMNKESEDSDRPEAGREIIDDNYPHTDMSEESRELDEYLTNIQHRAQENRVIDNQDSESEDALFNIAEGGQDDPMFDYERTKAKGEEVENVDDSNDTDSEESVSRLHESKNEKADTNPLEKVPKIESQKIGTDQHSSEESDRLLNPRSPKYRIA